MGQVTQTNTATILSQQLLLSVTEQLKVPLLQIARQAELSQLNAQDASEIIQTTAESALRLIDNYVLGVRLSLESEQLAIEPVSVSSVLYDTGQQLDKAARQYGIDLELNIAGRFGPVMANKDGLQAALVSLGTSLIEALPAMGGQQLTLHLATHRCRYGIVAGLYADVEKMSGEVLRQGRRLQGKARQPLAQLSHGSAAGIFVADAILQAMDLELKVSRHHRLYGLGTVLQPSRQLQLV